MKARVIVGALSALLLVGPAVADQAREDFNPGEVATSNPATAGPVDLPQGPSVLYDNGPLVNSPGTGVGGADEAVLQNVSLGLNTLGAGHQVLNGNRVADDFTIVDPGGWDIDAFTFFAYQTGSSTTSTITAVNFRIHDAAPPGGTVIFGDNTTNVLTSTGWSNVYRVTETTTGVATDRPVMANTVQLASPLHLDPGTYWVDWQTDGSLASGPWAPPININGTAATGNALQSIGDNGVTFAALLDGGVGADPMGLPFIIEGVIVGSGTPVIEVPTVGTVGFVALCLILGALAFVSLRRRRTA
ncbi:MAG: hypothetical protein K8J08_08775 [Thermoanaerobaculia bacterium]|nr:hypothetical protein [Thermoanaerobaculia bacterium]